MDPKSRIVECLAGYRISDPAGRAVDPAGLADEILASLGERRTMYSCLRQDLDIPCEHTDRTLDIIVMAES